MTDSASAKRSVRTQLESNFDQYLATVAQYLRQAYADLRLSQEVVDEIAATVIVRVSHSKPEPASLDAALYAAADDIVRARRPQLLRANRVDDLATAFSSEAPISLPSLRLIQKMSRAPAANTDVDGRSSTGVDEGHLTLADPPLDLGASIGVSAAEAFLNDARIGSDAEAQQRLPHATRVSAAAHDPSLSIPALHDESPNDPGYLESERDAVDAAAVSSSVRISAGPTDALPIGAMPAGAVPIYRGAAAVEATAGQHGRSDSAGPPDSLDPPSLIAFSPPASVVATGVLSESEPFTAPVVLEQAGAVSEFEAALSPPAAEPAAARGDSASAPAKTAPAKKAPAKKAKRAPAKKATAKKATAKKPQAKSTPRTKATPPAARPSPARAARAASVTEATWASEPAFAPLSVAAAGVQMLPDEIAMLSMTGFPNNPKRAAKLCVAALAEELSIETSRDLSVQVELVSAALEKLRTALIEESITSAQAHLEWQRVARRATLHAFFI